LFLILIITPIIINLNQFESIPHYQVLPNTIINKYMMMFWWCYLVLPCNSGDFKIICCLYYSIIKWNMIWISKTAVEVFFQWKCTRLGVKWSPFIDKEGQMSLFAVVSKRILQWSNLMLILVLLDLKYYLIRNPYFKNRLPYIELNALMLSVGLLNTINYQYKAVFWW
jgi:hypothetical protein